MKTKNPFFLTEEIAERAVKTAFKTAVENFPELRREDARVVVLVPTLNVDEGGDYPSKYSKGVTCLYQKSFGDPSKWEHDYAGIAQCKASQLWDGSNPGGSVTATPAHLLYQGDTPFWGGDVMEGIVVACSGVQPYFDRMVSRIALSMMIALAAHVKETSTDIQQKASFLGS